MACGDFAAWRDPFHVIQLLFRYGAIEHILIQIDFLGQGWRDGRAEYTIPKASKASTGRDGYADVCSLTTGGIWDIKPDKYQEEAAKEAAHYVKFAGEYCQHSLPAGMTWKLGDDYKTGTWSGREDCAFTCTLDGVKFDLIAVQPEAGAICYHWERAGIKVEAAELAAIILLLRGFIYEAIFGSKPTIPPRKRPDGEPGKQKPRKPRKITKPAPTPELIEEAAKVGLFEGITFDSLPDSVVISPFMSPPMMISCIDSLSAIASPLLKSLRSFLPLLYEGERAAILLDDVVYSRLDGPDTSGERPLNVGPASQSKGVSTWRDPELANIVDRIRRLPEDQRTFLTSNAVLLVAGGVFLVVIAGAMVASGVGAPGGVALAIKGMAVVGSVAVTLLVLEGTSTAATQSSDPAVRAIGTSVANQFQSADPFLAGTSLIAFSIKSSNSTGIETVIPRFVIVDDSVNLRDPVVFGGAAHRVIALADLSIPAPPL